MGNVTARALAGVKARLTHGREREGVANGREPDAIDDPGMSIASTIGRPRSVVAPPAVTGSSKSGRPVLSLMPRRAPSVVRFIIHTAFCAWVLGSA